MPEDARAQKIEIVPGITDNPLPANYQGNMRGPNGAYFIKKYNDLIEWVIDRTTGLFSGDYNDLNNKPVLGSAALTDSDDYATAAQGALADSALQPEDLGTLVQPYDPFIVSDALYVRTEESYTTEEKLKLSGIEPGAQANPDMSNYALSSSVSNALENKVDKVPGKSLSTVDFTIQDKSKLDSLVTSVQADWNQSSGPASILNKPDLSTKMSVLDYDSNSNGVVDIAETVKKISSYGSIYIAVPTVTVLPLFTAPASTLIKMLKGLKLEEGSIVMSIEINEVPVAGLNNLNATTASQDFTATSLNSAEVGSRVTVSISSVSSAVGLEFTLSAEVG